MLNTTTETQNENVVSPHYWRLSDLQVALSLSRATIYKMMKLRDFPTPIKLSPKMALWKVEDVIDWVESHKMPVSKKLAGHSHS